MANMLKIVLSFSFAVVTGQALAIPLPKMGKRVQIPQSFTGDYNFEGIVALSNCSGSLIRFEMSKPEDPAMVLTNGHCYEGGFIDPDVFLLNESSNRGFSLLAPDASTLGRVRATKILYASMTKTDVTLYQLGTTFAEIESQYGVHPLTLSSTAPIVATPIEVISGYWERGYSCQVEAIIPQLKEGDWTWTESIRYSRPGCEVIGGTSGSPVVATGTRTVIGINNTGNEDGEKCSENNPCEIDENGNITYTQGYSYAEQTYWIYTCLAADNTIDVNIPGCLLYH
jgi:V8-like Glu-specific endopeptidase